MRKHVNKGHENVGRFRVGKKGSMVRVKFRYVRNLRKLVGENKPILKIKLLFTA